MTRFRANLWWSVLALGVALEVAWFHQAGFTLGATGSSVGLRTHELATARGKVGYTVGSHFGLRQPRGDEPLRFLVIEGPTDPALEQFRGRARVIFDAARTSRMWLPVTRTELIDVNGPTRRYYLVRGAQVTAHLLPEGLGLAEFGEFLNSPAARDGVEGWTRWLERRLK